MFGVELVDIIFLFSNVGIYITLLKDDIMLKLLLMKWDWCFRLMLRI